MKLYLDSKDLINLLERETPISLERLKAVLGETGSTLVLSFATVAEIAAPLLQKQVKTNVMTVMRALDDLPLSFIAHAAILELKEAVAAYREGREYNPINPYVRRFDHTLPLSGPPPTAVYLNYPLAETVWDLWSTVPRVFDGYATHRRRFEQHMNDDRSQMKPPSLQNHFPTVVESDLALYGVECTGVDVRELGAWIYESPTRCPAQRLVFEAWHRLRANVTDGLKRSDQTDLIHCYALPYVHVFTCDRRMRGYLAQILDEVPLATSVRVVPSATEAIDLILSSATKAL